MSAGSAIEQAFAQVETLVKRLILGEKETKGKALMSIFRLNNEIGKLARLSSISIEPLRALQFDVNRITVAVRTDNRQEMDQALEIVRSAIRDFQAKLTSAPST